VDGSRLSLSAIREVVTTPAFLSSDLNMSRRQ
jgi:hypothetical protein